MKKFFTFAALAMVAIVACNKEIDNNEEKAPGVKPKGEVSIIAQAPAETKTMVDGLDVKWATGDHIGVVDNDGDMHDFTLDSGAGTTTGSFSGSLGGKTAGGYAVYPYTANAAFDGDFTVDYPTTYAYNAVTVPMWGEEGTGDDAGKYSFSHIGGAFKIHYTDVPAGASKFVFTANEDITGTAIYDFSAAVISANEGNEVTVTSVPSNSSLTFLIPVPAGSYSFSVQLLDGSEDVIPGSEKTVSSAKTVTKGHVVPLKAIKVKADRAVTLWSEDFEAYDADQPSESSASVLWGGNASYTYSGNYCKVYENGTLGSKELLIPKSSRTETWVVSNIPTGHWDSMTLTYKSNQNISVTSTDVTVGNASQEGNTYTWTITNADGVAFFSLTFSMGKDSNARIDDICLITGEPLPGITVTTSAATATSTEAGTTATLNGSITLINSADNANVTEAGFYYKLTSAKTYTKVTCASAPTSTTSFSYNLAGLKTDSEYTYYAYAVYDNGSEVTGKATEKTFTPTQSSGSGGDPEPVEKSYSFAFTTIGTTGWSNSYANHDNVYNDDYVAISIKSASKQTNNVTDYPVTKDGDVIVILKDGTMSAVTFTLTQWTTKAKTVLLQYSTDGGESYSALNPAVSSNDFTLSSSSLPTGTNAVKMVQGNTTNQVGLIGVSFTYTPSN